VDTNADDAIDAHSAIPVLDVLRVNNAPTALLGGPYSGVEGTPITFDASASTDVDGDSLQYRWDYTSDGAWDTGFDASAISPPITFGDDATGTVTVEVTDGELTSLSSASYVIANAAPVITSLAITGAPEGSPVTITGTFMDPGWLDTHTAFVEWGTGEMDTFAVTATHDPPAATGTFTITHTYGDDFTYAGTLVLMDDDGGSVVQDLSVPVSNVAPAVGPTDVQLFVQAQICLRVAGKTWNTVHMDLYRDDVIVGSISVTRARGSPNDQARCILADVDLLASHVYRAEVTFDPAPGAKTGSNSVWVLVAPMKTPTTPGHSLLKFHHVFHVGNPATYSWKVPLTSLASKLIGGCGCGDKDDDDDHEDDHHDGCGDSDDGCGDDGRDCSGDDGCDDEAGCDGSDQSCGLDTGTARDRASSDQNSGTTGPSEGRHEFVGPNDGHEDDHKKHCGDDDRDQGCDDDREHDDDDCGETGDHDGEHDDGDCGGGIQVHLRATATDAGTDDLTFTWSFSDGTSVARTYFNNGASPDPRPSSPGVRPFVVIDTVIHSLKKSCGKQVTLTVADDDGGVTTLILTIRA